MKTIISEKKEAQYQAAIHIKDALEKDPACVLALSAGRSLVGLYEILLDMFKAGKFSLKKARVFSVTEFLDVEPELSCKKMIYDDFLKHTDIPAENCFFPHPDKAEEYEELISANGGIDLAVLGLGNNAHIGFNEPATPFASLTHVQKLTDITKSQYAEMFSGADKLPERAITMGIKTLIQAKDIILLAFGEEKAEAVHKMLYGRNDSVVPAAFLQIPMNVTVYLDGEASSQL